MTAVNNQWKSRPMHAWRGDLARELGLQLSENTRGFKIRRALILLAAIAAFAGLSVATGAQSLADSEDPLVPVAATVTVPVDATYVRPTHKTKFNNYLFDTFGPYPIAGAAIAAGINQYGNAPPEWHQGAEGYGKRFGSDFAIVTVATTTRFALADVFKEDTLYYRCQCSGIMPRMSHTVTSTLTARRGKDGHRVFSLPALIAPYAGTMTAVYGWYPDRFGAKDAFRMGNYSLLAYMGCNVALEFLSGGHHSLFARMHLHKGHNTPVEEANQ